MTRTSIFAATLALGFAACGPEPDAGSTTEPGAASNIEEEGELAAEVPLPPLPTHWPAETPVGAEAPVTEAMLRDPLADRSRWLLYTGDDRGFRHSPIEALSPANASRLEVAWAFPTGTHGQFEVSPVVYGGVMYITSSYNRVFALDAKTGEMLWRYDHVQPKNLRLCCGPPNRGVAILGNTLLMGTLDAKLLAFDRRTGTILWEKTVAAYDKGFSITSAPLIVGDLAMVGVAGGEYGVRGFLDAYEVATGERVWRHYTVPEAGEPGVESWAGESWKTGGAPTWTTGNYDAERDTLLWTTGNPSPDWNGDARQGDNLYSNSILALDPKTGERKWHFQFTPHDVWDFDGNTHLFLVDLPGNGDGPKQVIAQANRNGYFYLLERATGRFLRATPYLAQINWATIGSDGRPQVNPAAMPQEEPTEIVCPHNLGGMNGAWTGAFHPGLGLAYIPAIESCERYMKGLSVYVPGLPFMGGMPDGAHSVEGKAWGHLSAIDVATGEIRWRHKEPKPMMAGVLSTAGGLVFSGTLEGDALGLDAATGEELWRFRMGGGVRSQPIAYEVDGVPHVAIGSGSWPGLDAFAGGIDRVPEGGHLFVFKLRGE